MSDYEVQYQAATEITRLHARSHDELTPLSSSAPTDIDGGAGADLLLSILGPIASDTGTIAGIHSEAANRMAITVDRYSGIEEDAAEAFRKMGEAIR